MNYIEYPMEKDKQDKVNRSINNLAKANTKERIDALNETYKTLSKRVYLCDECNSHIITNKNESVKICNRCGSNHIHETITNFIPLKFSEIKDKDTIELSSDDYEKYARYTLNNHFNNDWFIHSGVVKISTDNSSVYYNFTVKDSNFCMVEAYYFNKVSNAFVFFFRGDFYIDKDSLKSKGTMLNENVSKRMLSNGEDVDTFIIRSIGEFKICHMIFNYLASQREIEELQVKTNDDKTKTTTTSKGKTITKKRHIVYITDSIKIYTYDNTMASKLRNHKPISLPYWKVREFTRRVFAKEDKHLPRDERRVVKVARVPAFLKGKDRHNHSLDEIQTIYKIARTS